MKYTLEQIEQALDKNAMDCDGEDWEAHAACRGEPTALFFPATPAQEQTARAICHTCPVQVNCLHFAMNRELYGVWGGISEKGRGKLLSAPSARGPYRRVRRPGAPTR